MTRIDTECQRIDRCLVSNLTGHELIDGHAPDFRFFRMFAFLANLEAASRWLVGRGLAIAVFRRQVTEYQHAIFDRFKRLESRGQLAQRCRLA